MSAENLGSLSPDPESSPLMTVTEWLDIAEHAFFQFTKYWVDNPDGEQTAVMASASSVLVASLRTAFETVLTLEDLPKTERATILATIYKDAEASRASFFQTIAPSGNFEDSGCSHDELFEDFKRELEEEIDSEKLTDRIMLDYVEGLRFDVSKLYDAVYPG